MAQPVPVFAGVIDVLGKPHLDDVEAYRGHLASLKNCAVEFVIRKRRDRKSQRQLGWYWGCILPALSEYTGYAVEELHAWCTYKFLNPPERTTLVIADSQGEVIEEADVQLYPDRVHLLTTGQMADFCEDIRNFAAERFHVVIPDPDKFWKQTKLRAKAGLSQSYRQESAAA